MASTIIHLIPAKRTHITRPLFKYSLQKFSMSYGLSCFRLSQGETAPYDKNECKLMYG